MYDYDWDGLGLTIYTPSGTIYMQGEEGSNFYDELELLETDAELEQVLSEYEYLAGEDE